MGRTCPLPPAREPSRSAHCTRRTAASGSPVCLAALLAGAAAAATQATGSSAVGLLRAHPSAGARGARPPTCWRTPLGPSVSAEESPARPLRGRQEARDARRGAGKAAAAAATAPLGPELRAELRAAARELGSSRDDGSPSRASTRAPFLALLERARASLEGEIALGLSLQGSYSQTKAEGARVRRPRVGDGAGPGPGAPGRGRGPGPPSPVQFEEGARLPARSYCGGPTKDHILESGGSGMALLDYDGDGRLDVYVVTAAELTSDPRARRAHRTRSTATSAAGSSRTSRSRRVWTPPPGATASARATSTATDASISTSRTGARTSCSATRATARFVEVAAQAGVAASGWSTGCTLLRRGRRRRPGPLRRALRRDHLGRRRAGPADAHLAQRAAHHGGPGRAAGRGRPLLREPAATGRFVEATEAHGLADPARGYGFGVVATDYDDDGFVDLFVANDSNPNFLYHNRGGRPLRERGAARRRGGERRGPRPGRDGRRRGRLRRRRAHRHRAHHVRPRHQDALPQPRRPPVRGRERGLGPERAHLRAHGLGRSRSSTPTSTAGSTCSSPTATSSRTSGDYPELGESFAQKNQLLLNEGGRFRDVSPSAGGGLQLAQRGPRPGRGRPRRRRRSRPRREQHGRRADAAREPPAHRPPLGRLPRRLAHGQPLRDRREGRRSTPAGASSSARSARAAAISRRATCARSSAWATTRVRWTWRSACPAAVAGSGGDSRATDCTRSSSPTSARWRRRR